MTPRNVTDLLLAAELDREEVAELLSPFGLKNPLKADSNLQMMAADPSERQLLAKVIEALLIAVSRSADPDQAVTYMERFSSAVLNKMRLFSYLMDSPKSLEILGATLGGSPYMAEILIRDPHHFYWLTDGEVLDKVRSKRALERELVRALKAVGSEREQLDYLRSFKRREMLHIGVRDLLRICSVEQTLAALSLLAEVLISAAYWICASELRRNHGIPRNAFTGFTILAMGKLGGGELNFSSDVDLLYLYASEDEEAGTMSAPEYFRRLCQKITFALSDFTGEGYVYRVDLRLRPEGSAGNIADSLDGFERYYKSRGGTWERLALLKAWPVAGSRALGRKFIDMARGVIYEPPLDDRALEDIRTMKRRSDQQIAARDQRGRNVKLGTGGIREIELIAQSLQVCHGNGIPENSGRNTLETLGALLSHSLISAREFETLKRAYIFLRDLENKLQMANDAQTHSLPLDREELTVCARRLCYSDTDAAPAADQLLQDFERHTGQVNAIFEAILGDGGSEGLRFSRSQG